MSEEALLERLMQKVQELSQVPFEKRLWDLTQVAEYMHRSPTVVSERIAVLPNFPKPVRIPSMNSAGTEKNKTARPLYLATEIVDWVLKHQK